MRVPSASATVTATATKIRRRMPITARIRSSSNKYKTLLLAAGLGICLQLQIQIQLLPLPLSLQVSALQPAKPKKPRVASTSLDYVSVAGKVPEKTATGLLLGVNTGSRTRKQQGQPKATSTSTTSTSSRRNWERLLQTESTTSTRSNNDNNNSNQLDEKKQQKKKKQLQLQLQVLTTKTNSANNANSAKTKTKTSAKTKTKAKGKTLLQLRTNKKEKQRNPTDLLTKEEEILFTQRIHALRQVEAVRDSLPLFNSSTSSSTSTTTSTTSTTSIGEAEWAKACGLTRMQLRRVLEQGQDARLQLVQANIGLVTSIAKRHYTALKNALEAGQGMGSCLTLQDCYQEGQLGLMEAAERFDPQRGVRFGTYATYWIRQRILKSITDTSRIIRLPAHVHQTLQKIKKAKAQFYQESGREPSLPELAHVLDMSMAKLEQYTQIRRNVVSLENPLQKGISLNGAAAASASSSASGSTASSSAGSASSSSSSATVTSSSKPSSSASNTAVLGDLIASDNPTPQEHVQQQWLRQDLHSVLNEVLTETERLVLLARFGLDDTGTPKSIQQTANTLQISRDKVRLVETKALNKLRRSPQKNVLKLKTYVTTTATVSRGSSKSTLANNNNKRAYNNDYQYLHQQEHHEQQYQTTTTATSRTIYDNNQNIYNQQTIQTNRGINPFASSPWDNSRAASAPSKARTAVRIVHNNDQQTLNKQPTLKQQQRQQQQQQQPRHPHYQGLPPAPAPDRMWFF